MAVWATDINIQSLKKAREGVYGEWSFRGTPQWIKERYFLRKPNGRLEIIPDIKKMVTFAYLNLAEDTYPSLSTNTNATDVIFCRNVMMYFARDRAARLVRNFHHSLVEGGWLIVGGCEVSYDLFSVFDAVGFPDITAYRKESSRAPVVSSCGLHESPPTPTHPAYEQPPFPQETEALSAFESETTGTDEPQAGDYERALALYRKGFYEEATQTLLALLAEEQDDSHGMALLARISANRGDLTEAVRWCDRALAVDRLDAELHYLRATILHEQGAAGEVSLSLKRALYLDPEFVLAYLALGNFALRQGKAREAARHFENALSLLNGRPQDEILNQSEGITAGRLRLIIGAALDREKTHEGAGSDGARTAS